MYYFICFPSILGYFNYFNIICLSNSKKVHKYNICIVVFIYNTSKSAAFPHPRVCFLWKMDMCHSLLTPPFFSALHHVTPAAFLLFPLCPLCSVPVQLARATYQLYIKFFLSIPRVSMSSIGHVLCSKQFATCLHPRLDHEQLLPNSKHLDTAALLKAFKNQINKSASFVITFFFFFLLFSLFFCF